MSRQVDHDLLADYVGGALDGTPEAQRVADLITTSPDWRRAADELSAALAAVHGDLGALREQTAVMPADVAARFDELFASPAMAGTAAAARDPLARREVTRHPARKRHWRRWAAPLAVAAASLAFFAIGGLPDLGSNQPGSAGDTALEKGEAPMAGAISVVPTIESARHYDRATLQSTFRATAATPLSKSEFHTEMPSMRDGLSGELTRLRGPAALQGCLNAVVVALPGKATQVEYAYFELRPALVISITSLTEKWAFVAGPSCGLSGPDELYRTPLK